MIVIEFYILQKDLSESLWHLKITPRTDFSLKFYIWNLAEVLQSVLNTFWRLSTKPWYLSIHKPKQKRVKVSKFGPWWRKGKCLITNGIIIFCHKMCLSLENTSENSIVGIGIAMTHNLLPFLTWHLCNSNRHLENERIIYFISRVFS